MSGLCASDYSASMADHHTLCSRRRHRHHRRHSCHSLGPEVGCVVWHMDPHEHMGRSLGQEVEGLWRRMDRHIFLVVVDHSLLEESFLHSLGRSIHRMVEVVGRPGIAHGSLLDCTLVQAEDLVDRSGRREVGHIFLCPEVSVVCSFGVRVRPGYLPRNAQRPL